jgi:uncharacterized protein YkwD
VLVLALVTAFWAGTRTPAGALSDLEACFIAQANAARAEAGLPALQEFDPLGAVARRHTQQMVAQGFLFHNASLGEQAPSNARLLGENVGSGETCESVHAGFMASEWHRFNILEPGFTEVGVGAEPGPPGVIYVTEVFMKPKQ